MQLWFISQIFSSNVKQAQYHIGEIYSKLEIGNCYILYDGSCELIYSSWEHAQ